MNNTKYYFYTLTGDAGFAPNPFWGFCTLACCKPKIRKTAQVGDWVIGLGSQQLKCKGSVIFAMKVKEVLTFDEYYKDNRFSAKKTHTSGRDMDKDKCKILCGDNVYHKNSKKEWIQDKCLHSHKNKKIWAEIIKTDLGGKNVLISDQFFYFGKNCLSKSTNLSGQLAKHHSYNYKNLFSNIKNKTKGLRGHKYNGMEPEGKALVNLLLKQYKKSGIYGDPMSPLCDETQKTGCKTPSDETKKTSPCVNTLSGKTLKCGT